MWSNRNPHYFLVGIQTGTTTWEEYMAVSYKAKHAPTLQFSSHTPLYLPNGVENLQPHKKLHTDRYSSFIHNHQNLEGTKMSFSR